MSMARAFPYVGHGLARGDELRVWIVATARTDAIISCIKTWAKPYALSVATRADGIVFDVRARGLRRLDTAQSEAAQAKLDDALLADSKAIAMAVRAARGLKTSAWHKETLADPARVLSVLERAMTQPQPSYARDVEKEVESTGRDMRDVLLAAIEGSVRAVLARKVLDAMVKNARARAARAVLDDLFEECLPTMLGHDFDLDVVLREAIATSRRLSSTTIQMRKEFYVEVDRRMSLAQPDDARSNDEIDWSRVSSVRDGLERKAWRAVTSAMNEKNPAHGKTLLALTHEERLALAKRNTFVAARMANMATHFVARREFADALAIYDAVLEGEPPVGVLANPLFAVQNDNNHLGVNVARARRYLERCLRGTPEENPSIFLNASFVCVEVGDHDEAIRLLARAKEHGVQVKLHRNEALFISLRERPDFVKLMK